MMGQLFLIKVGYQDGRKLTAHQVWELLAGWDCSVECEGKAPDTIEVMTVSDPDEA
jgi:hypothetical protein